MGICGEIFGRNRKNIEFESKLIKKKTFIKNRILFRLKSAFIFNDLDENETNILINAMEEVEVEKGKEIIKEGEIGQEVYILDEGEL